MKNFSYIILFSLISLPITSFAKEPKPEVNVTSLKLQSNVTNSKSPSANLEFSLSLSHQDYEISGYDATQTTIKHLYVNADKQNDLVNNIANNTVAGLPNCYDADCKDQVYTGKSENGNLIMSYDIKNAPASLHSLYMESDITAIAVAKDSPEKEVTFNNVLLAGSNNIDLQSDSLKVVLEPISKSTNKNEPASFKVKTTPEVIWDRAEIIIKEAKEPLLLKNNDGVITIANDYISKDGLSLKLYFKDRTTLKFHIKKNIM